MKLSSRIVVLVLVMLLLVSAVSITIVNYRVGSVYAESMRNWGRTITVTLAESIASDALNKNVIHARETLANIIARNSELEYAFMTDFNGKVFAYSFRDGFPEKLLPLSRRKGESFNTIELDGKLINSISYPLIEGMDATLHIGVNNSKTVVTSKVLIAEITAVTILAGIVAALLSLIMSRRLTAGLEGVIRSMIRYGHGDRQAQLEQGQITPEAAQLATAFQQMVEDREKSDSDRMISDEMLERIFDNTHTMMAYLDPDFNFIRVNKAYLAADNKTVTDLIGHNHFELYPNDENEVIFQQVLETGKPYFAYAKPFEYEYSPDKGVTHWNWSIQPIFEGQKVCALLLVLVDVTEHICNQEALIKQEEDLRASKQLNDTLIANAPVGIAIYDYAGNCITANRAIADAIGGKLEQVLAQNYHEIESWKKSGLYDIATEVLNNKTMRRCEFSLTTSFGKEIAIDSYLSRFDINDKPHLLLILNDVSERNQAEAELRIKDAAIEASINPIAMSDMEGHITYVNQAYVNMWGYESADEILGRSPIEMSKSAEEVEDTIKVLMENGAWMGEIVSKRKDGTLFDTQLSANLVRDNAGKPVCMMASFVDVTERKQMLQDLAEHQLNLEELVSERTLDLQDALKQLKSENDERRRIEFSLIQAKNDAEQANQLKSEFLGRMSHELRTPMNAILGFSQLLETEELDEDAADYVREISQAGHHLLGLINEVLDLSKIETGKIEIEMDYISLFDVVEESLSMVQQLASTKNITIENRVPENRTTLIHVDKLRYTEVLVNLLSNAVKYGRDNGTVIIDSKQLDDDIIRVMVVDDGDGIPEEKREFVFEPFNRLGAEYTDVEGTGIGLTIARQLIEQMQGHIGLQSTEGEGSTFWIETPMMLAKRSNLPAENTHVVPPEMGSNNNHASTVLYVEDNQTNLRLVKHMFGRLDDVRLYSAPNAELGIELARSKQPDVILLDINLPGMDGYEALAQLRKYKETADIPVLAVSAAAMKGDIERGLAAGFKHYITKPIKVHELLKVVREELDCSQARPAAEA